MSNPYRCDDCGETFHVELSAFAHADERGHTVRYWGDDDE